MVGKGKLFSSKVDLCAFIGMYAFIFALYFILSLDEYIGLCLGVGLHSLMETLVHLFEGKED